MKFILTLVALTTCLVSTSLGAPQIFPFSNLRSYFDHQSKHGPGSEKDAVAPELTTLVDTPLFRRPSKIGDFSVKTVSPPASSTKFPKNQLPLNHKAEISPSLEPPSASAAASPVVKYHPPIPEQVLKAPDAISPILYGSITEQDKTQRETKIPQVTSAFVSQVPISVVGEKKHDLFGGFLPSIPSQVLRSPPPAFHQKPVVLFIPTVPSQVLQSATVAFGEPQEEVRQKKQENHAAPKEVNPAKIIKAPNHSYPKKWRPEKEKDAIKKKNSKTDVGNPSNLNSDSSTNQPKINVKEYPGFVTQSIPTPLEAASSFQKKTLPIFPIQAAPKVPGIDEQITSETGFSGITAGVGGYGVGGDGGGGGDRVEFQMHGQHGPHSYKFGYDTGKGHNRQFRYEERDTHGHVKGHYGFYNKHGKLQIVNYSAHPEHGFQADGNYGKHGIA